MDPSSQPLKVPFGNVFPKYSSRNPLVRWMMRGFLGQLQELAQSSPCKSVLEVGCGQGELARRLAGKLRPSRFVACDLEPKVDLGPDITYRQASIYRLPFSDDEFDLVLACEVLEHLEDPRLAVQELARVARHAVIVSTPNEPLWRVLNVVRGRYLEDAGNTPGHVQHFSRRDLWDLCNPHLEQLCDRQPLPWTIVKGQPRP